MHAPTASAERGFTLFEVLLVTIMGAALLTTAVAVMTSTSRVSEEDRLQAEAESAHRRNMEYLCNVLRNASATSLGGFDDVSETAVELRFRRPTGAAGAAPLLGDEETLVWRPSTLAVSGVLSPGDVWLVTPSGAEIAAARVPDGGFLVQQDGRSLVVQLTTYYPAPGQRALRQMGTATVSLRN